MVRPPMFSKCVSVRYEHRLSTPEESMRRLTAGGIAALVALTVITLVLAALVGMMAGLAPTLTTESPSAADAEAEFRAAFAHAHMHHSGIPAAGETAQH